LDEGSKPASIPDNPLQVILKVCVNNRLVHTKTLRSIPLPQFNLSDVELALYAKVDRVLDNEDYTINKHVAILKTLGRRGSRCTQHLNTFSEEEAADLKAIYHQYALRFRHKILQGIFKL
jgi:hypothetical protein